MREGASISLRCGDTPSAIDGAADVKSMGESPGLANGGPARLPDQGPDEATPGECLRRAVCVSAAHRVCALRAARSQSVAREHTRADRIIRCCHRRYWGMRRQDAVTTSMPRAMGPMSAQVRARRHPHRRIHAIRALRNRIERGLDHPTDAATRRNIPRTLRTEPTFASGQQQQRKRRRQSDGGTAADESPDGHACV